MSANGNGFTEATFTWLDDLAANNTSSWFAEHRDRFQENVEEPFVHLIEDVTRRLAGSAVPLRGGAATTFRINRDVRFSTDKSPYATHRSAVLTWGGTKAESGGLLYVRLAADGGLLAGGLYKPPTSELDPFRKAIVDDPDRFGSVVAELAENGHQLDRSEVVKTMPRGYTEHADQPYADHLRLKQLVVMKALPRAVWLEDSVDDRVCDFARGIAPLLAFVRTTAAAA